MKKKLLLATASILSAGLIIASTTPIAAEEPATHQESLIQRLAQKFNVKESDVKAVFDEERAARRAEHHQQVESKLTEAVSDGKLTEAQKQLILTKHAELQREMEQQQTAWQAKTPAERRTLMAERREALEQWAQQNNIDLEYFRGPSMMGNRGHRGMMGEHRSW
jgi:hypothetical protein